MGLDFITPLANGVAKDMIKRGVKSMLDPFTGNLAIRRGKRVFEITREKYKRSVEVIFLYCADDSFAAFKIEDDFTLSIVSINMKKFVTLFTPYPYMVKSTVQSNLKMDQHYAMVETVKPYLARVNAAHVIQPLNYGKYELMTAQMILVAEAGTTFVNGMRNSFEWSDNFNNSISYVSYDPTQYVCSSKTNWLTYEDDNITNLELWKVAGVATVKYLDSSGTPQTKAQPTWNVTDVNYIHAIISPDLYIGRSGSGVSVVYQWDCAVHHRTLAGSYLYKFGSVTIDSFSGTVQDWRWLDLVTCYAYPTAACFGKEGDRAYKTVKEYIINKAQTLDYDCLDNSDETFILFYVQVGSDGDYAYGWGPATEQYYQWALHGEGGHQYVGAKFTEYKMAYRVDGGDLTRVNLATLIVDPVGHMALTGDQCSGTQVTASTDVGEGQRIINISCKIIDGYITYTYVIEDYTMGTYSFPESFQDDAYTFNSRVLGLIDLSTGERHETIVTDEVLGKYAESFDNNVAAAIGFHRGTY